MTDEERLSPQEISKRIVVGMGLVYDLYNELVGFLRMVRETLEHSELELSSLTAGKFKLPLGPRRMRTAADDYVSVDLGMVFEIGVASEEEEDDDSDDESEEKEAELEKKGLQIAADSQFLAIRVILYDRNHPSPAEFEPIVVASVLSDMTKKSSTTKTTSGKTIKQFTVRRNRFLHLLKNLWPDVSENQTISARVPRGQLNATVAAIMSRPLAEFRSEKDVQEFMDQITNMVGS